MALPVAALALTAMASRCKQADVSACATAGVEDLVTTSGGAVGKVNGAPAVPGVGFGPPSSALTLTFLLDGVPAWADLAGAEYRVPPREVDGIPVFKPSGQLAAGSEVVFHCPRSAADVCDAWVFFYSCPQSCSGVFQGGVPAQLAGDGWQHTNCAPRFVTGVPSGFSHQMRSYRMKLDPGQSVSFTTAVTAEFLSFGLDIDGVDCSKLPPGPACDLAPHGSCVTAGTLPAVQCVATTCRRGGQGPPPPCTECPWQGIKRRDPSFGPF